MEPRSPTEIYENPHKKRSEHYIQSQNQNAGRQSQLQKQIPRPPMQTMWKGRQNTRTRPGEVRENQTNQTPSTHRRHLHGGPREAEENGCKNRGNPTNNQQPPPTPNTKNTTENTHKKTNNHHPTHPATKQPTPNPTTTKNRPTTQNHKTHTTTTQTPTRIKPQYRPKRPPCDQGKYTLIWSRDFRSRDFRSRDFQCHQMATGSEVMRRRRMSNQKAALHY